ncbi:unnamed protein product [Vicia faba]|uniref:WRKY domain-containing protein n=1 Tax=Vicia faba TaxID=3906 RepID=A0AAV0YYN0_VICFA|nr:unnamed protein product [Vicia faba]
MCSSIFVSSTTTMDNYQGDLTDIIRATGTGAGAYSTITSSSSSEPLLQHHHHHHDNQWHPHPQPMSFSNSILEDNRSGSTNNINMNINMNMNMNMNIFGDPLFSTLRDPFLQELDHIPSSSYFNIPTSSIIDVAASGVSVTTNSSSSSVSASAFVLDQDHHHQHHHHEMMRSGSRPCKNIFSNMIQISPNATKLSNYESSSSTMAPSPRQIKPVVAVSTNININAKDSLLDNSGGTVQISSSRNNTGLKRRKNQAKKVVCIPAPAAANSRQTGEVVPSDLWAWRKYGQKPIKGSPYPRGYYRCSSSKGCSARKQVERSRTDPNMLVITYTSEHNHPWPTQRNALAGSTRSQPSKNNTSMKNSETSSQPQNDTPTTTTKPKEEQHQESDGNGNDSPVVNSVKEESMEDIEKLQIEMDEGDRFNDALSYKPCLMENNQSHEDFFAELGEIEADPLNLLFNQGFGGNSSNDIIHQRDHQSKSLDAFHLFDWSGDNNNNNNSNNSFEEPNKRRLL